MKKILIIISLVLVSLSLSGQDIQHQQFKTSMQNPQFKTGVCQMACGGVVIGATFAVNALIYFSNEWMAKEEFTRGSKIIIGALSFIGAIAGTSLILVGYSKVNQYNNRSDNVPQQVVQHTGPVFTIKF